MSKACDMHIFRPWTQHLQSSKKVELIKGNWAWSGYITITQCRPTRDNVRKSHRTLTVTRHQEDNLSKATRSLFLFKMISKLERIIHRKKNKNKDWNKPMEGTFKKSESCMKINHWRCALVILALLYNWPNSELLLNNSLIELIYVLSVERTKYLPVYTCTFLKSIVIHVYMSETWEGLVLSTL